MKNPKHQNKYLKVNKRMKVIVQKRNVRQKENSSDKEKELSKNMKNLNSQKDSKDLKLLRKKDYLKIKINQLKPKNNKLEVLTIKLMYMMKRYFLISSNNSCTK